MIRLLFFFSLLVHLLLMIKAHANSDALFERLSGSIFRVKTALSANADKASYGTGFVVDKDQGLLITNYHVVSDVIQRKDGGYKNYVMIENTPFEATILGVDVVHDLALVKINKTFPAAITIRSSVPRVGEKIFSLGIPEDLNLSIVDGLFNGFVTSGPFSTIQMSTPLNAGMSGGPTTDVNGELVGVNVSGLADNLTFAVPAHYVRALIENGVKNPLPINNFLDLHQAIEEQLVAAQEVSAKDMRETSTETEVGPWKLSTSSKLFKCWMSKNNEVVKIEKRKLNLISKVCNTIHNIYLDSASGTLIMKVEAMAIDNLTLNRFQFADYVNSSFNSGRKLKVQHKVDEDSEKLMTKYKCEDIKLTNKHKLDFLVGTCMRGYHRYPKLIESYTKLAVIDPKAKGTLILEVYLDGFTAANIKLLLKEFIENVRQ